MSLFIIFFFIITYYVILEKINFENNKNCHTDKRYDNFIFFFFLHKMGINQIVL